MRSKQIMDEPIVKIVSGEQSRQMMMTMLAKLAIQWHESNCKLENKPKTLVAQSQ